MTVKKTKEEFIKKSIEIHGKKYDYSKVNYKDTKTKIIVICKEHGEFTQIPVNHIKGHGCKKCSEIFIGSKNKSSKEKFIEKAKEIHGEKYDYSKVNYQKAIEKVIIICKEHGEFIQIPNSHLRGCGCPKCSKIKSCEKQRKNQEDFIKKSCEKHGNKYDYSRVIYINNSTKIIIICKEHGEFEQTPAGHLCGGCSKCGHIKQSAINIDNFRNKFIEKTKEVHGDKYNYSKVNYQKAIEKVVIICDIHGEFEQTPNSHLQGNGCYYCGIEIIRNNQFKNQDQIIERFKKIHGNKYDYTKVEYKYSKNKVIIICKEHGEFEQTPHKHLFGRGCPKCLYKNEQECREILEKLTCKKFNKIVKMFVIDGTWYELDGYNEELKMAFEYQGEQHYFQIDHFHREDNSLLKQQIRDEIKKRLCKKEKIKLIEIPYYIENKELFIKSQLN
jgi:hypothetical protein